MRVLSWNVRKAVGLDWVPRPARAMAVIAAQAPDVVLLQEVDARVGPSRSSIPRELIAAHGFRAVELGGRALGHRGNAMLVRDGLAVGEARPLDLPSWRIEPRGGLLVRVEGLWIAGVHLSLGRGYRRRQVARLTADLPARCLVAGDFNERAPDPAVLGVAPPWEMTVPGPSFHAAWPRLALDRFLHRGVTLRAARVVPPEAARRASDHLPVVAEVAQA